MVHHGLSQLPGYFDELIVISRRLIATRPTAEVFQRETISAAFDHTFQLRQHIEEAG